MTQKICDCEALPPTGDVGELIEKCRRYADSLVGINDLICGPLMARCALLEAADALTAAAARIEELGDWLSERLPMFEEEQKHGS